MISWKDVRKSLKIHTRLVWNFFIGKNNNVWNFRIWKLKFRKSCRTTRQLISCCSNYIHSSLFLFHFFNFCAQEDLNSFRFCFERLYIACEDFYFHIQEKRLCWGPAAKVEKRFQQLLWLACMMCVCWLCLNSLFTRFFASYFTIFYFLSNNFH